MDGDDDDDKKITIKFSRRNKKMEQTNKRVLTSNALLYVGKTIVIKGWIKKIRQLGNIGFLVLRDRTGTIQCVLENNQNKLKLENESVVEITGKVIETDKTELGVELLVSKLVILSKANLVPFEMNKQQLNVGLDHLLNHRVLSLRHEKIQAIFSIQSMFVKSFTEFLNGESFQQVFTPKIVSQGAEGGANVFTFPYFKKQAYLAQSPQFYKQMMVGAGFERVFEVAPVFRAEEHNSSRHLNEYISLDVELGFIESMDDVMELERKVLAFIFHNLEKHCQKELAYFQVEIPNVRNIPKLTLEEAHTILKSRFFKESPIGDLNTEGEKLIGQYVKEQYNSDFVFITHYPKESRPMYTMPSKQYPGLTESYDLLYNGTEITSGGQRIHDQAMLIQSFKEKGLNPLDFSSYIQSFAYGFPPHGGFAIGLERMIMKFLRLGNIREASAFPRDCDRLIP